MFPETKKTLKPILPEITKLENIENEVWVKTFFTIHFNKNDLLNCFTDLSHYAKLGVEKTGYGVKSYKNVEPVIMSAISEIHLRCERIEESFGKGTKQLFFT